MLCPYISIAGMRAFALFALFSASFWFPSLAAADQQCYYNLPMAQGLGRNPLIGPFSSLSECESSRSQQQSAIPNAIISSCYCNGSATPSQPNPAMGTSPQQMMQQQTMTAWQMLFQKLLSNNQKEQQQQEDQEQQEKEQEAELARQQALQKQQQEEAEHQKLCSELKGDVCSSSQELQLKGVDDSSSGVLQLKTDAISSETNPSATNAMTFKLDSNQAVSPHGSADPGNTDVCTQRSQRQQGWINAKLSVLNTQHQIQSIQEQFIQTANKDEIQAGNLASDEENLKNLNDALDKIDQIKVNVPVVDKPEELEEMETLSDEELTEYGIIAKGALAWTEVVIKSKAMVGLNAQDHVLSANSQELHLLTASLVREVTILQEANRDLKATAECDTTNLVRGP